MQTTLASDEIHLWLTFYDEINDAKLLASYRGMLTDSEKEQETRFRFLRDRTRYLVTRALVRTVLSRYAPLLPTDWIFSPNAYGRPEAVNIEARDAQLSFNISHTHSLIVLGITKRRELGVDVERIDARQYTPDIAASIFSLDELEELNRAPPEMRQDRFFEYWTFKESYIKARGMGLTLPLDKFSFSFPREQDVRIAIGPELTDQSERWEFWQLRPTPDYLIAVCAERRVGKAAKLSVRKIVPLQTDALFDSVISRHSIS